MAKKRPNKPPKTKPKPAQKKASKPASDASAVARYNASIARSNAKRLAVSRTGRDIAASCPEIKDRERRDATFASLREFLEVYFPSAFRLAWSEDHLKVISRLEAVMTGGGRISIAAPRGFGKTSLFERAAIWALVTGRRRFVTIVAATEWHAEQLLHRIKTELEHNELLLADYPKAVWGVRCLESQARRAVGQLWDGERTCIVWQAKRLVLPTVPGPDSEASGGVLHAGGITSALRGLNHVTPTGEVLRPDLVLLDDPSTRESAGSFVQNAERLATIESDLAGLAGPGKSIAMLAAVTVVKPRDLADRLLDRDEHPEWDGERLKLVYEWPIREDLWREYERLRIEGLKAGDRGRAATEFYRANRLEMDAGARVAWPQRYEPGELSAIQHAYNLKIKLKDGFDAEFQNSPVVAAADVGALDPVRIASRCGGFERGVAPPETEKITAFIDVGADLLWWMVCGWSEAFDAAVLDYGPFPEQQSRIFHSRNADPTLDAVFPHAGSNEAAIYAGLEALVGRLLGREWLRMDGARLPIARLLIDSGYATSTVRLFIRQSAHRDRLSPSKGAGIGPARTAIADYRVRPGERRGEGWIEGAADAERLRLVKFDSNLAKTRMADMLTRAMGERGGVTLYGDRPAEHELLGIHLASEYPTATTANGNTVNDWQRRPDRENHLLDCLIGCSIAAGMEGLSPLASFGGGVKPPKKRQVVTMSELQRQARARRAAGGMRP